jgi:hypothetical protein
MTTPQALASSPKTFLERDDWMRAILASDLTHHVLVRVGITIALHLNVDTGQCNPSYPTLARESGVSERSIYRLVAALEHAGWRMAGEQRNRSNPSRGCASHTPLEGREREIALSRDHDPSSAPGGRLDGAPGAEGLPRDATPSVGRDQETNQDWRTLRDMWRRPWPITPKVLAINRAAFDKACATTDPGTIIDGARPWVAAFADAPRYLPALSGWLADRGWEKPPPQKRKRAPANRSHSRGKGEKADLTRTMMQHEV